MKRLATLLIIFLSTYSLSAHAIYGTADKIVQVADWPDTFELQLASGEYVDVGYCYRQAHIFFIPLWNYNERYCGYLGTDEEYLDISKTDLLGIAKELDLDTSWDNDQAKIPLMDRIGGKIGLVVLIIMFILYHRRKKDR
ncbi:hypothetical protein L0B52_04880 [Suttonella sp. R2A3]|uniref:hypothetical protein n=1 Tax=Suttonella sp. R2A3 TaxID=2908648 RepID=UPI001F2E84BB|nr:hypothetical protein [Suttonella sp. R2A3]UJF23695.1 hypothetical protein L0B52_04880 [Suttonella sp. R2A3]